MTEYGRDFCREVSHNGGACHGGLLFGPVAQRAAQPRRAGSQRPVRGAVLPGDLGEAVGACREARA